MLVMYVRVVIRYDAHNVRQMKTYIHKTHTIQTRKSFLNKVPCALHFKHHVCSSLYV